MKTFEERYTAWVDGKLEGPALTAFELELSRRAAAGEARADKADAARLHSLLTTHLAAPTLTNTEFFNHQLHERVEADRNAGRRREASGVGRGSLFAWSFGKLAGLGGALLFVAVALFYGLMPQNVGAPNQIAKTTDAMPPGAQAAVNIAPTPKPAVGGDSPELSDPSDGIQIAQLDPKDIPKLQVDDQSKATTATPLHYAKPDVNVIWINGLDYLPSVPGDSPVANAAAASPTAATVKP